MFHQKLLVDVEPEARPLEGRHAPVAIAEEIALGHVPLEVAAIPTMSWRSVVLAWWATAPGERPWCDSPQPITPSSVVTFTTTESRVTARPIPSVTLGSAGRGSMSGTLGRRRCACAASRRVQ